MNSERFLATVEVNLTLMAPDFVPGIIRKQLDELEVSYKGMTPVRAKMFISNVSDALSMFVGPEKSKHAKRFMMKTLRDCCTETEIANLMEF